MTPTSYVVRCDWAGDHSGKKIFSDFFCAASYAEECVRDQANDLVRITMVNHPGFAGDVIVYEWGEE